VQKAQEEEEEKRKNNESIVSSPGSKGGRTPVKGTGGK